MRFFGATVGDDFLDKWVGVGYNVVQVAWGYDPENTWIGATVDVPGNMLYANCRTATLMDWVYRNETSGGNKICILAHSAGYGEALFGSLDYAGSGSNTRLDSEVAHFLGETGGAQGDPDAGCTYGTVSSQGCAGSPTVNLCPKNLNMHGSSNRCPTTQTGPYCWPAGGFIDSHDNTGTRCNSGIYNHITSPNTLTDQQTWQASGLDTSTNAIPNFAITATTSMFQCNVNEEAGQFTFIGNLLPVHNYTDFRVASSSACNGTESYSMNISGGLDDMINDMENNC